MKIPLSKGFTLIELLVVIGIIAILTAIITSNFTQSKAKARDAERVSDLANIQLALELFFDRCNEYPPATGAGVITFDYDCSTNSAIKLSTYISKIPKDPWTNEDYVYTTTGDPVTDYELKAVLETAISSILDDSTCPNGNDYCVKPN